VIREQWLKKNGTIQHRHIIEPFRPDVNSVGSQRPCSAMHIASDISKFFSSLSEFNQPTNENLYIVNEKTLMDFIGMSRSMLSYNIN
jgi:hypothetical protein